MPEFERSGVSEPDKPMQTSCTSCAGVLFISCPSAARGLVCPNCSMITELKFLGGTFLSESAGKADKPESLHFAVGDVCTLSQGAFRVVSVVASQRRKRALLYNPRHGFRLLVESDGHFSLYDQLNSPPSTCDQKSLADRTTESVSSEGRTYEQIRSRQDKVRVAGEIYSETVCRGELLEVDFLSLPFGLLATDLFGGTTWWKGRYIGPEELSSILRQGSERQPEGVGLLQPNPYRGQDFLLRVPFALSLILAFLLLLSGVFLPRPKVLLEQNRIPLIYDPTEMALNVTVDSNRKQLALLEVDCALQDRWLTADLQVGPQLHELGFTSFGTQEPAQLKRLVPLEIGPNRIALLIKQSGPPHKPNLALAWRENVLGSLDIKLSTLPQKKAWWSLVLLVALWVVPWVYLLGREKEFEKRRLLL